MFLDVLACSWSPDSIPILINSALFQCGILHKQASWAGFLVKCNRTWNRLVFFSAKSICVYSMPIPRYKGSHLNPRHFACIAATLIPTWRDETPPALRWCDSERTWNHNRTKLRVANHYRKHQKHQETSRNYIYLYIYIYNIMYNLIETWLVSNTRTIG